MLWKCLYYPKQSEDSIPPYQTTNDIFFKELGLIILQFIWGEKDPEGPKQSWKERWNWTNQPSDFRLYSQDTMVQAQKQKQRAKEQDTKLRDEPTLL